MEGIFHRKKGEIERLKGEFHRLNPGAQLGKWEERIEGLFSQFNREFRQVVDRTGGEVEGVKGEFRPQLERVLGEVQRKLEEGREGLERGIGEVWKGKKGEVERLKELFSQLDPGRGRQFLAEIWREGEEGLERVRLKDLKPGEKIRLITPDGEGIALFLEFHPYQ
jgi:exonuclease VII large subunit